MQRSYRFMARLSTDEQARLEQIRQDIAYRSGIDVTISDAVRYAINKVSRDVEPMPVREAKRAAG